MNFLAISVVITVMLYNSQIAAQERDQLIGLSETINKSQQANSNTTDRLVLANLAGTDRNYVTLVNRTEQLNNLILHNQELIKNSQTLIKNTTETNLRNTFLNRDHISEILAEHVNIIHQLQSIQRALNITTNNTED